MTDAPEPSRKDRFAAIRLGAPAGIGVIALVAVLAFGIGVLTEWLLSPAFEPPPTAEAPQIIYACPMHPEVRSTDPDATCPICGMRLERVGEAGQSGVPLRLSETARQLMQLETAPVERRAMTARVSMVGQIDVDETRIKDVTAWAPGRLERLYVDYTGMPVRQGDHLVELYSPELLSTQAEVIQTARTVAELTDDDSEFVRDSALANAEAARDKARQLGLTDEQIERVLTTGEAAERLTIYAPVSGIVVRREATQGQYVQTGSVIYTIADLSQVWVRLDANEADLPLLRYGQEVTFTTRAYGGQPFTGRVAFISPVVDEATRRVAVRVFAPNPDGRLMPGMFVQAELEVAVTAEGAVAPADLAGKWLCPMHPEQIADGPADCEVCGMPLEPSESLGYAAVDHPGALDPPLVIPGLAVLQTGKRAIVYVHAADADDPYRPREVVLGPRVGDYFVVLDGLRVGERVVAGGTFMLDSERKLRGLSSMTNPPPGGFETAPPSLPVARYDGALSTEAEAELENAFNVYLRVHEALANDDPMAAVAAVEALGAPLDPDGWQDLPPGVREAFEESLTGLFERLQGVAQADNLNAMRAAFRDATRDAVALARRFGDPAGRMLMVARCPMAFDNAGADWLQLGEQIRNPYFGSQMSACGSVIEHIAPTGSTAEEHDHD